MIFDSLTVSSSKTEPIPVDSVAFVALLLNITCSIFVDSNKGLVLEIPNIAEKISSDLPSFPLNEINTVDSVLKVSQLP